MTITALDVKDLSSEQISQVLDRFVAMMLEPVVNYTDYGFELAASLLTLLQDNRRIVCQGDKVVASTELFRALCLQDRHLLFQAITNGKFERNLILYYINLTINSSGEDGVDQEVSDVDGRPFVVPSFPPKLQVEYEPLKRYLIDLHEMYNRFRLLVIGLYNERILKKQAERMVYRKRQIGVEVTLDDAYQACRMAAIKALDKFSLDSGPLTNYLIKWVSHADSSKFLIGVGESFAITRSARSRIAKGTLNINNRSVDIEASYEVADLASNGEDALTDNEYFDKFSNFISRSGVGARNPLGVLLANIPYALTPEEIRQLKDGSPSEQLPENPTG